MAGAPFYITTAIAYPNGDPHIGHAYEAVTTDFIARFMRADGRDVRFTTGTDEHGLKMEQTARREGLTAPEYAARMTPRFQAMDQLLNISFDDFIHTMEDRHKAACEALWRACAAKGDIYLGGYKGWYSVRDEAYFDDDELTEGEGGKKFAPSGAPVEWVEEPSYFFRLSAYQEKLLALYEQNPDFIQPASRRNEVIAFVKRGLKDLSVSRTTFTWGVPVPDGPGHVMYVWFDALTNYLTSAGYPDQGGAQFQRYWPTVTHLIGKDVVRFHAIYWPAFLMSAGISVPARIFGHGFLLMRGEKMSKSLGNVIAPADLVERYGLDQLRYFFLREVAFGSDGSFTHDAIVNRTNADLANDLGNLAQRSLSMINKNLGGVLPEPGPLTEADQTLLAACETALAQSRGFMAQFEIHRVLEAVWAVVADANRYFAGQEPWALKKSDPARMGTVLWVTAEALRNLAILAQPAVPGSAAKLLDLLAVPADRRSFAQVGAPGRLAGGTALPAPSPVFPRYVEPEGGGA